jgi:hypothetical protein
MLLKFYERLLSCHLMLTETVSLNVSILDWTKQVFLKSGRKFSDFRFSIDSFHLLENTLKYSAPYQRRNRCGTTDSRISHQVTCSNNSLEGFMC